MTLMTMLGGCGASTYRTLPSERDVPLLRELLEAGDARPSTSHLISTEHEGRRASLALHETGPADADRLVVLIHGCASSAGTWRYVAGDLGDDHRLLLVDLLGCGSSEAPDPATLGPRGYSPEAMAHRVSQALVAHLEQSEALSRMTLVGHSLGGAVVLRLLGDESLGVAHRAVLDRVDRAVLLTPLDVEFVHRPPTLQRMATISGAEVALGDASGLLKEVVARGVRDSVCVPHRACREAVDEMCRILTVRSTFRTSQAILQQAVPRVDGELDWPTVERLTRAYANVDVPCLILWGAYDDVLPVSMGHKLSREIPDASFFVVPDCKHSVQVERPAYCADAIRRFSAAADPSAHDFALQSFDDRPRIAARSVSDRCRTTTTP